MDHPMYKKQKVGDGTSTYKEEVLFNSDTLSKIISYLPSTDLLNLAVTCKRFGVSNNDDDSIIKESSLIAVQEIATEEQLAALPRYEGESSLADYHYLQLLRQPLTFDQLCVGAEYVNNGDKTLIKYINGWATGFSNNILRAGKHYATFKHTSHNLFVGVMRPGQANQKTKGYPYSPHFFRNFVRNTGHGAHNNNDVQCWLYHAYNGKCYTSDWELNSPLAVETWDAKETTASGDEIGMLLDLDEGTLSVYKNGRKLGVKRGLKGHYCWVVSMWKRAHVTIKREMIPPR